MPNIDIADGKYTFVTDERGLIQDVLRHGEPWVQGKVAFQFNGCVRAMLSEIEHHRVQFSAEDEAAIAELCTLKELSRSQVIRQAVRIYQGIAGGFFELKTPPPIGCGVVE